MKFLKVLELSAALLFMLLLKLCHNNVEALAKEDTMANVKDIDFYQSIHSDALDVGGNNGTTSLTLSQNDEKDNDYGNTKVHSRGKRFIAFPVGSSFSTAVCMTTGVIGNPNEQYLSLGLNWGIAYELPNSTWVLQHANGFGVKEEILEPQIKRRHRRDLYGKLEILMDGNVLIDLFREFSKFPSSEHVLKEVAVCFTVGIIGNPRYNYMSFGLNWGVAYDLPNTSWILNHLHGFAKRPIPVAVWHRRSRRALYKEIENVVDNMGYNGRDCILRALCESRQYFQKNKMGMIGEMLRVMFSLPKQRIFTRELDDNSDIELYDRAYRKARSVEDCSEQYKCSFSLLELAFGKYSTAPEGYYGQH